MGSLVRVKRLKNGREGTKSRCLSYRGVHPIEVCIKIELTVILRSLESNYCLNKLKKRCNAVQTAENV